MTTTSTLWKAPYQLAPGLSAGAQSGVTSLAFANGRILTVWCDEQSNIDSGNGFDIVGQFRDARGNPLGSPYHVNNLGGYVLGHQTNPRLAALPDGGAILVFDNWDGGTTEVKYVRLDAAGNAVAGGVLATGSNNYKLIDIDVMPDGDILVGFKRPENSSPIPLGGENQYAVILDSSSLASGPLLSLGQATNDLFDPYGFVEFTDIAALKNGNFALVYQTTGPDFDLDCKIFNQTGGLIKQFVVNADKDAINPRIAALEGGGFAVAWDREDLGNSDCRVRVYDANGNAVSSVITLAAGNSEQHAQDILALPDGGFYAVHHNEVLGNLHGQRFSAAGAAIGVANEFAADPPELNAPQTVDLSLTSDGRIIISYLSGGDPMQAIVDPRNTIITGTAAGEVITAQTTASSVFGAGGEDLLWGSGAGDLLAGEEGSDILRGGAGNDSLNGGAQNDFVYGEDGNDTIFISSGHQLDYVSGGAGVDRLAVSNAFAGVVVDLENSTYNLHVHFPTIFTVIGVENVSGTARNDTITGDGNANVLSGGGGNDGLSGGIGGDALSGGDGDDRIDGGGDGDTLNGDRDSDFITGGGGNDTIGGGDGDDGNGLGILRGEDGDDSIAGGNGIDRLEGGNGDDRLNGGSGNDVSLGGAGADTFVFLAATSGNDRIDDWTAVDDQLEIDASAFGGGLAAGAMAASRLVVAAAPGATQAFGQFLYNTGSGQLSWDVDGTGAGAAVQICRLLNGGVAVGTLAVADFDIVA